MAKYNSSKKHIRPLSHKAVGCVLMLSMVIPLKGSADDNYQIASFDDILPTTFFVGADELDKRRFQMESGIRAVNMGMANTGLRLLVPLLDKDDISTSERSDIVLAIITALLQKDEPQEAERMLRNNPELRSPPFNLRRALASFQMGQIFRSRAILLRIDRDRLSEEDVAWAYLLEGLIYDREGLVQPALRAYDEARDSAISEFQKDSIRAVIARQNLLRGDADEETLQSLKQQLNNAVTPSLRIQLAREYAMVLAGMGRPNEAVTFLESFIANSGLSNVGSSEALLLPLAIFRGLSTSEGKAALWDILRSSESQESLRLALTLLLREVDTPQESALENLKNIIENRPDHPLRDRLIFARITLLTANQRYERALNELKTLFDHYPGSEIIEEANLSQAFLAWKQSPPQFRTAASALLESLPKLSKERKSFYLRIAGDLFFMNGDYGSAADAYLQSFEAEQAEDTAYQYVLTLLREGRTEEAIQWTDSTYRIIHFSPNLRWQMEWNLAQALIQQGSYQEASFRVDRNLTGSELTPPIPISYNFRWLQAYLKSVLNEDEIALTLIAELLRDLGYQEEVEEVAIDSEKTALEVDVNEELLLDTSLYESSPLIAQVLLLEGEVLLKTGRREEGMAVMRALREKFPDQRAAILSYLFEARYFAGIDLSADAQLRLVNLADRYPRSDYAPIALYEASIIAESRDTEESIKQSLRLLEGLVDQFPEHPLAFYSRLRQGEILRSIGDFQSARMAYENTMNRHPTHSQRYLAEISLAETVLANPDANPESLLDAAAVLLRVIETPNVPSHVLMESHFKRASALRRAGQNKRAGDYLWGIMSDHLNDEENWDASSSYWISRGLLELATWRELDGDPDEAKTILQLVEKHSLPGSTLARARLRSGTREP